MRRCGTATSQREAQVPSPEDDGRRENYDAGCQLVDKDLLSIGKATKEKN
jgi:hypothetical protein